VAFPRKFRNLLEIEKESVTTPSHVWVTYCVCAVKQNSCGWGGWTLEAVFSDPNAKAGESLLKAQTDQKCPVCGGETFRTGASFRFDLSSNQTSPVDFEYNGLPMEFTDD